MARSLKPLDGEREARLHAVAAESFLTDGFERASLHRIIDEARIAKSSSYHYFADKRALYDHSRRSSTTIFAPMSASAAARHVRQQSRPADGAAACACIIGERLARGASRTSAS